MNTHEGCGDPRAKIGTIAIEALSGLEAKLGMSVWEYRAQKDTPAGLNLNRPNASRNAIYCFRLLECGRWLPLNRHYRPLGIGARDDWRGDYEAYADRVVHFPTDPHELDAVWCSDRGHSLYLYNGNPASLKSYYLRLARLRAAMDPWRTQGRAPAPAG